MIMELRNTANFDWEVDIVKGNSFDIPYLLGIPRK
jgi:hypothetical protein